MQNQKTLYYMLDAEARDPGSGYDADREDLWVFGYGNTKPGTQYSVVTNVKEDIEMELAVFNQVDPLELYHEKEYYLEHPMEAKKEFC